MVAVAGDLVAVGDDRLDRVGETLGDGAAGQERRLHVLVLENAQDSPDRRVRAVFALGVFLVVARAVGQRADVLAALEIEGERDRDLGLVRPDEMAAVVVVLQHARSPCAGEILNEAAYKVHDRRVGGWRLNS